jgi:hypothetical protein
MAANLTLLPGYRGEARRSLLLHDDTVDKRGEACEASDGGGVVACGTARE